MKPALVAFALLLTAGPAAAAAQEAGAQVEGDWDLVREGGILSAYLTFSPGPNFVVRCLAGHLDATITDLPAAAPAAGARVVEMRWADGRTSKPNWEAPLPQVVSSRFPAWHARMLRQGGSLRLIARSGSEATQQFQLEIPTSSSSINQVLQACRTPLEDPADAAMELATDAALNADLEWSRRPEPIFPAEAQQSRIGIDQGSAQLICRLNPDGRFSDCAIQSELPSGVGFGRAAVASMRQARATPTSAAPPDGQAFRLLAPLLRFRAR